MSMPSVTRLAGFLLIVLGLAAYLGTGRTSVTALIPAFVGALFLILALIARGAAARRHAMHAALAIALISLIGVAPRAAGAVGAGDIARPAVLAQIAMIVILLVYVLMGVRSFMSARRLR